MSIEYNLLFLFMNSSFQVFLLKVQRSTERFCPTSVMPNVMYFMQHCGKKRILASTKQEVKERHIVFPYLHKVIDQVERMPNCIFTCRDLIISSTLEQWLENVRCLVHDIENQYAPCFKT